MVFVLTNMTGSASSGLGFLQYIVINIYLRKRYLITNVGSTFPSTVRLHSLSGAWIVLPAIRNFVSSYSYIHCHQRVRGRGTYGTLEAYFKNSGHLRTVDLVH